MTELVTMELVIAALPFVEWYGYECTRYRKNTTLSVCLAGYLCACLCTVQFFQVYQAFSPIQGLQKKRMILEICRSSYKTSKIRYISSDTSIDLMSKNTVVSTSRRNVRCVWIEEKT